MQVVVGSELPQSFRHHHLLFLVNDAIRKAERFRNLVDLLELLAEWMRVVNATLEDVCAVSDAGQTVDHVGWRS